MSATLRTRLAGWLSEIPRREKRIVIAAMALSVLLVLIYIAISPSHVLAGDEPVYDEYGRQFADGNPWEQSLVPYPGDLHASAWKAPLYPAWVGVFYTVLGSGDWAGVTAWERVEIAQALLLAPLTVLLTWLLARRLFGPRAAIAAAALTAVFPLVWEYFGLLTPEALAIPLTVGFLLVVLDRTPTPKRAVGTGVLLGLGLLVHPTAFVLAGALLVAWWLAARGRGLALCALAGAAALLVVLPWAVRNLVVFDGALIPISIEDAAVYGTFNSEAANDPDLPYAWRENPEPARATLEQMEAERVDEAEFHSRLRELGLDYIGEHPESVPNAIVRNGVLRFWDLRPPQQAIDEVEFQGRSTKVRGLALAIYYPLLIAAAIGMWRLRHRREIVLPLLTTFALVAVVFMVIAGTRYRAPLEPVLVILACSLLATPGWTRARSALEPDPMPAEQ